MKKKTEEEVILDLIEDVKIIYKDKEAIEKRHKVDFENLFFFVAGAVIVSLFFSVLLFLIGDYDSFWWLTVKNLVFWGFLSIMTFCYEFFYIPEEVNLFGLFAIYLCSAAISVMISKSYAIIIAFCLSNVIIYFWQKREKKAFLLKAIHTLEEKGYRFEYSVDSIKIYDKEEELLFRSSSDC